MSHHDPDATFVAPLAPTEPGAIPQNDHEPEALIVVGAPGKDEGATVPSVPVIPGSDGETAIGDIALAGIPPAPPGGGEIAAASAPPEPGRGVRFVTDLASFMPFDALLRALGDKDAENPVIMTITPEALVFDVSSPAVPCQFRLSYTEGGAPTATASIEVPSRVLRHLGTPNRVEVGSKPRRYFEGNVVWLVDVEQQLIRLDLGKTVLNISTLDPSPVRAAFPEPTGAPIRCAPGPLRTALLAVAPAASTDYRKHPAACQIEVEDGRATAISQQLFAQIGHEALDGLQLRIAERDVKPITKLLALANASAVTVQADDEGATIADERLRFGFRSLPAPMPFTQPIAKLETTQAFDCDRSALLRTLEIAGTIVAHPGARALQISFSLVVRHAAVCLRVLTEWRPNQFEEAALQIRMTPERHEALYRLLAPAKMEGLDGGEAPTAPTEQDIAYRPQVPAVHGTRETSSLTEELPRLDLGYYLHANVLRIVRSMKAPILSCRFIDDRALFIGSTTDQVHALFVFEGLAQDQAHGLTTRR